MPRFASRFPSPQDKILIIKHLLSNRCLSFSSIRSSDSMIILLLLLCSVVDVVVAAVITSDDNTVDVEAFNIINAAKSTIRL